MTSKKEGMKQPAKLLTYSSIILFVVFLILSVAFYFMLSSKTGIPFGFKHILFALGVAVLVSAFLLWIKVIVRKNLYLGLAISFLALLAFIYSVRTQYRGPYTTIFLLLFSLIFVGYTGYVFFRYKKFSKKESYEYDDKL